MSTDAKCTLEALEGKTPVAKSELAKQQEHRKRQFLEEDYEVKMQSLSSSYAGSLDVEVATCNPPSLTPYLKKGHSSFFGHTPRGSSGIPEVEANGPTYSHICQPVHENLLSAGVELSSERGNMVDNVLHKLLQSGDAAQKYMQGSRSKKIDNWILLDNAVQGRGARIKASKSLSKRSKRHMSLKQHKKYGSYDFPREFHRFETFMPMHNTWKDYITQLIKNVGKSQLAQCLLSVDLHGAILLVAESKIISFTGATGIMVRETAETFGLITRDDKFRGLLCSFFKPTAGRLLCMEKNSFQEILQCDFDLLITSLVDSGYCSRDHKIRQLINFEGSKQTEYPDLAKLLISE